MAKRGTSISLVTSLPTLNSSAQFRPGLGFSLHTRKTYCTFCQVASTNFKFTRNCRWTFDSRFDIQVDHRLVFVRGFNMLHPTRSMQSTIAALCRLVSKSRMTTSEKVPTATSAFSRAFSQRPSLLLTSKILRAEPPVFAGPTIDGFLVRSYATATKKKSSSTKKSSTTKKKASPKKKAAKKPKKRAAKKKAVKKKVAKKPKKPTRPKTVDAPSGRGISGYVVYVQNQLKSIPGPGGSSRLSEAVQKWKALSEAEKEVFSLSSASHIDFFSRPGKPERNLSMQPENKNTLTSSPKCRPLKSKKKTRDDVHSKRILRVQ